MNPGLFVFDLTVFENHEGRDALYLVTCRNVLILIYINLYNTYPFAKFICNLF